MHIGACEYSRENVSRALFIRAWLYWVRKEWKKSRAAFDDLFALFPDMANDPPVREYVRQCDENISGAVKQ